MKKLAVVASALLLAACGSSTPTTGNANLGTGSLNLSGRITNYTPSRGGTLYAFYGSSTSSATGTVDSSGNFVITLPAPVVDSAASLSNILSCSSGTISRNVTVSPDTASISVPNLSLSSYGASSVLLSTDPNAASGSLTLYAYAQQNADATGSFSCDIGGVTVQTQVNLHLVQGWNIIVLDVSGSGTSGTISFHTASAPAAGSAWYDAGYVGNLPGQSLHKASWLLTARQLFN